MTEESGSCGQDVVFRRGASQNRFDCGRRPNPICGYPVVGAGTVPAVSPYADGVTCVHIMFDKGGPPRPDFMETLGSDGSVGVLSDYLEKCIRDQSGLDLLLNRSKIDSSSERWTPSSPNWTTEGPSREPDRSALRWRNRFVPARLIIGTPESPNRTLRWVAAIPAGLRACSETTPARVIGPGWLRLFGSLCPELDCSTAPLAREGLHRLWFRSAVFAWLVQ